MLNNALRLIRVFHDLKQNEAADRLSISKSYLSELEKGSKEPSLEILRRYEKVFDIPVSSILFFSEKIDERNPTTERARTFVASKVVNMMKFLESKGRINEDA